MIMTYKQRVLLLLLAIVLSILCWQLFLAFGGEEAAASKRPQFQSMSQIHSQVHLARVNAEKEAKLKANQAHDDELDTRHRAYLKLITEYQIAQMKRMIAKDHEAIAIANRNTAKAMIETSKLTGGKFSGTGVMGMESTDEVPVSAYQLLYTGQRGKRWDATVKFEGRHYDLHEGEGLPDGAKLVSIQDDKVMFEKDNTQILLTFSNMQTIPKRPVVAKRDKSKNVQKAQVTRKPIIERVKAAMDVAINTPVAPAASTDQAKQAKTEAAEAKGAKAKAEPAKSSGKPMTLHDLNHDALHGATANGTKVPENKATTQAKPENKQVTHGKAKTTLEAKPTKPDAKPTEKTAKQTPNKPHKSITNHVEEAMVALGAKLAQNDTATTKPSKVTNEEKAALVHAKALQARKQAKAKLANNKTAAADNAPRLARQIHAMLSETTQTHAAKPKKTLSKQVIASPAKKQLSKTKHALKPTVVVKHKTIHTTTSAKSTVVAHKHVAAKKVAKAHTHVVAPKNVSKTHTHVAKAKQPTRLQKHIAKTKKAIKKHTNIVKRKISRQSHKQVAKSARHSSHKKIAKTKADSNLSPHQADAIKALLQKIKKAQVSKERQVITNAKKDLEAKRLTTKAKQRAAMLAEVQKTSKRFSADEKFLLSSSHAMYTIELMTSDDLPKLKRFVAENDLQDKIQIYTTKRGEQTAYVLVYGQYPSQQMALTMIASLPVTLHRYAPIIKRLSEVQGEIRHFA